jgi:hypothetical protein
MFYFLMCSDASDDCTHVRHVGSMSPGSGLNNRMLCSAFYWAKQPPGDGGELLATLLLLGAAPKPLLFKRHRNAE